MRRRKDEARRAHSEILAGFPGPNDELGKYFLPEDDLVTGREHARDAFFCSQHGKEYITLVNNKRCSHAQCWKRGCFWGKDGKWVPESHPHMRHSVTFQAENERKMTSTHAKAQLHPNWGKLPMTVDEPSTAAAPTLDPTEVGLGVAVAAPPVRSQAPEISPLIEEDSGRIASGSGGITRKESLRHVESTSLLGELVVTPEPKPAQTKH